MTEKNVADSGATSHMVKLEGNMKKLKHAKTQVTLGDSVTLTRKKLAIGTVGRDVTKNYIALH